MASTFNYLLKAYFHQDWKLDANDSLDIIRIFVEDENIDNIFSLENEIQYLLANYEEREKLFEHSENFNPKFYNFTTKEWLEFALATINQSLETVKVDYSKIRHNAVLNTFYQEFACYYQPDELPKNFTQDYFLNKWAKESAVRLSAKINDDLLLIILERMINQRSFYFNRIIELATDFDITKDDDDWQLFKQVYTNIQEAVRNLKG